MRRPNLWIVGTEEGEHHSEEGTENALNKIIEEKKIQIQRKISLNGYKGTELQIERTRKETPSDYIIIIKMLKTQNKGY